MNFSLALQLFSSLIFGSLLAAVVITLLSYVLLRHPRNKTFPVLFWKNLYRSNPLYTLALAVTFIASFPRYRNAPTINHLDPVVFLDAWRQGLYASLQAQQHPAAVLFQKIDEWPVDEGWLRDCIVDDIIIILETERQSQSSK